VKSCSVRLLMTKVRDSMSEVLDRVSVADMIAMGEGGNFDLTRHGLSLPSAARSR
jgi:DNA-binding IscR family transcriptional regulator